MMRGLGIFVAKGKTYNKARFTACSGSVRRYLKFKENRKYIFTLDAEISTGSVTAELLDSRKNVVFTLTDGDREGVLYPEAYERYLLIIRLRKAGGKYELIWT